MKTILPALLAATAIFPAAATAATTTVGSDLSGAAPDTLVQCTNDEGSAAPCTITQDTIGGAAVAVPAGKVVTAYTGYFDEGSSVGLRLMRRNADGTLTSDGYTGYTYTAGGIETIEANLPVPAGKHTIAIDLLGGSVGALPDSSSRFFASDQPFGENETAPAGDAASYEMLVNVTVSDAKPAATPTPGPDPDPDPEPTATPSDPGAAASGFSIEKRAVLGFDGRTVDVFTRNELDKMVDGRIALKVGGKTFAADDISEYDYHSSEDFSLPIKGKPLRRLMRRGRLSATVVAKTTGGTFRQGVKIARGGAKGYDGTYRGPGPLVIVVKRGVIQNVSQSLNLFCPRSNAFMTRTMGPVPGYPALVKKDGSFFARGSRSGETLHYKGRLQPNGISEGYLSLFYTHVALSGGSLVAEDCYQASNFKVKRS